MALLDEIWHKYGPGLAGAIFGAGWWFWVDAVAISKTKVEFVHYLPGIFATIAALMFNCVRREDLQEYDPYDDGAGCRSRVWLFLSYVLSFVSLAGSVGLLINDYANPAITSTWPGVAGVCQCTFILGSGLLYWMSRSSSDS
ncbi:hypothetical protein KFL_001980240 [Klebsormidium nitens]|uniref:Transmembrane protein 50A n=1 Tax=Klebsormidium nitens TaxID=105231 RepID=A0A1Y1I667_KLENI|nr:hypothetical protein KFL_001980240 [Klebsormidium nitens]|eukprot:GAQ84641.1 hypothetical protein KFL_001980240 [Klebsormidium nitens]